jgi:selenocysteine lyase/cysteine desulfurase
VNWTANFDVEPGFLNTASLGVPPRTAYADLTGILDSWRLGRLAASDFDGHVDRARAAWAKISMVEKSDVAIGSSVSGLVGIVAASLPSSAKVLVAEGDFTSVTFPFLVQADRGVTVQEVPLAKLIDSIDDSFDLVAVSSVQSSDGRRIDADTLAQRANECGVKVLIDTTQSCGWLPLDCSLFDYTVCAAYKWLLSPRGVAFMSVRPASLEALVPHSAGWFGGEDVWNSIYGTPLRLAQQARRLDTSPAWFSWVGAASALEFLAGIDANEIFNHNVALANSLLFALDLPAQNSAIITLDRPSADERLKKAGVRTAIRAGKVRASFHLYNTEDDVALAANALR